MSRKVEKKLSAFQVEGCDAPPPAQRGEPLSSPGPPGPTRELAAARRRDAVSKKLSALKEVPRGEGLFPLRPPLVGFVNYLPEGGNTAISESWRRSIRSAGFLPGSSGERTLAQATRWNRPGNDTLRIAQMNVSLRPLEDPDLDTIYQQATDPESVRMAAFTAEDQTDRRAFLNRMSRLRADTSVSYRVIDVDGAIAGTIASFRIDNQPEVTYWVDRTQWGKGIASAALQILLAETAERPLYARAASDNVGSLRVLEKAGFRRVGVNRDFAPGRGEEIEETILRLD